MERLTTQHPANFTIYDIIFIGGGPSTLSFFSYLIKHNHLDHLISNLNILIIERSDSFGSGCLGNYGINSNTSADGFLRLIYRSGETNERNTKSKLKTKEAKEAKQTLSPNKVQGIRREKVIPMFNHLSVKHPATTLYQIGGKPAPLSLIGHFLNCIGSTIAEKVFTNHSKEIVMFNSEVQEIIYERGGSGLNTPGNSNYYTLKVLDMKENVFKIFQTKVIVFANGAKQHFDQKMKNEVMTLVGPSNFFHSDYILRQEGYLSLLNNLNENHKKKIVIIGGSHSGFSAAWVLLNGPARVKHQTDTIKFSQSSRRCRKCEDKCICFGDITESIFNWPLYPHTNQLDITILHRDLIKVYYQSERDAQNDGYITYDPKKCVNKNGNVYPFIGIRGDAKELFRQIKLGHEKRVKLIQTKTSADQRPYIQQAGVVIWACGYVTDTIRLSDQNKREISLSRDYNEQVEVDKNLRLADMNKDPISTLFGIGQGYSTNSIEIKENGMKGKADSVNLYNTHTANKLYKSLDVIFDFKNIKPSSFKNKKQLSETTSTFKAQTIKKVDNSTKFNLSVVNDSNDIKYNSAIKVEPQKTRLSNIRYEPVMEIKSNLIPHATESTTKNNYNKFTNRMSAAHKEKNLSISVNPKGKISNIVRNELNLFQSKKENIFPVRTNSLAHSTTKLIKQVTNVKDEGQSLKYSNGFYHGRISYNSIAMDKAKYNVMKSTSSKEVYHFQQEYSPRKKVTEGYSYSMKYTQKK